MAIAKYPLDTRAQIVEAYLRLGGEVSGIHWRRNPDAMGYPNPVHATATAHTGVHVGGPQPPPVTLCASSAGGWTYRVLLSTVFYNEGRGREWGFVLCEGCLAALAPLVEEGAIGCP